MLCSKIQNGDVAVEVELKLKLVSVDDRARVGAVGMYLLTLTVIINFLLLALTAS